MSEVSIAGYFMILRQSVMLIVAVASLTSFPAIGEEGHTAGSAKETSYDLGLEANETFDDLFRRIDKLLETAIRSEVQDFQAVEALRELPFIPNKLIDAALFSAEKETRLRAIELLGGMKLGSAGEISRVALMDPSADVVYAAIRGVRRNASHAKGASFSLVKLIGSGKQRRELISMDLSRMVPIACDAAFALGEIGVPEKGLVRSRLRLCVLSGDGLSKELSPGMQAMVRVTSASALFVHGANEDIKSWFLERLADPGFEAREWAFYSVFEFVDFIDVDFREALRQTAIATVEESNDRMMELAASSVRDLLERGRASEQE